MLVTEKAEPQLASPVNIGAPAAQTRVDQCETVILVHGTFATPDPADAENRRIILLWFSSR